MTFNTSNVSAFSTLSHTFRIDAYYLILQIDTIYSNFLSYSVNTFSISIEIFELNNSFLQISKENCGKVCDKIWLPSLKIINVAIEVYRCPL